MIQVQDGEETYQLEGRVAAMVRFLAQEAERLNGRNKVRLIFNCAGSVVEPKIEFHEDTVRIELD